MFLTMVTYLASSREAISLGTAIAERIPMITMTKTSSGMEKAARKFAGLGASFCVLRERERVDRSFGFPLNKI